MTFTNGVKNDSLHRIDRKMVPDGKSNSMKACFDSNGLNAVVKRQIKSAYVGEPFSYVGDQYLTDVSDLN